MSEIARITSLQSVDYEQVAKALHVGVTVRPCVRCNHHGGSQAFDSDWIGWRERLPEHSGAACDVHAKYVNLWRPHFNDGVSRIDIAAVVAPLQRDISSLERWHRLSFAPVNRK